MIQKNVFVDKIVDIDFEAENSVFTNNKIATGKFQTIEGYSDASPI